MYDRKFSNTILESEFGTGAIGLEEFKPLIYYVAKFKVGDF